MHASISHRVMTPAEAASRLGIEPAELDQRRRRGDGPGWVKLGRIVRYLPDDLDNWRDQTDR